MIDLTKYSEKEIDDLVDAIYEERLRRLKENFPYKVGDCFCEAVPDTQCRVWEIVRIEKLDRGVTFTIISINASLDRHKYTSTYNHDFFLERYKTPIDPSIFDEFSKSSKIVSEEKSKFVRKMMELRYDKRRTSSENTSETCSY